jgi:hypothetical protein
MFTSDEKSEVVYTIPVVRQARGDRQVSWHSCCFTVDKAFVQYIVQTFIGVSLLIFCAYRLSTEPDCDRAAPFWGLIGTVCGFFFNRIATMEKSGGVVQTA